MYLTIIIQIAEYFAENAEMNGISMQISRLNEAFLVENPARMG